MNTFFCSFPVNINFQSAYSRALDKVINEKNPSIILCVIPSNRNDLNNSIKHQLTVDRGGILLYIKFKEITCYNNFISQYIILYTGGVQKVWKLISYNN